MSVRRALWTAIAAAFGLALSPLSLLAPSATAATLTNTSPNHIFACGLNDRTITDQCLAGALQDFNGARAKEGLSPMKLPANFRSLSVPLQVLTLSNIDRRDRGLPPFAALAPSLNPYTQPAADNGGDPAFPSWTMEGGSNWASPQNSLWAEFLWMYDDGPGGSNLDCTSTHTAGCWGHRDNILRAYSAPRILGASVGKNGIATLLMGRDTHDWNLLTPNAPANVQATQVPTRRIKVTWATPAARGPAITAYYFRRDGGSWVMTTAHTWTTATLPVGTHTVAIRSRNKNGYSPIRTLTVRVN